MAMETPVGGTLPGGFLLPQPGSSSLVVCHFIILKQIEQHGQAGFLVGIGLQLFPVGHLVLHGEDPHGRLAAQAFY